MSESPKDQTAEVQAMIDAAGDGEATYFASGHTWTVTGNTIVETHGGIRISDRAEVRDSTFDGFDPPV